MLTGNLTRILIDELRVGQISCLPLEDKAMVVLSLPSVDWRFPSEECHMLHYNLCNVNSTYSCIDVSHITHKNITSLVYLCFL